MKKFLLLSTLIIGVTSCSISKQPEFKYVDNIIVKNISLRNVTLKADAVFNNPNHLKGKLSIDDVHIFVDNIDVGTISAQEFDVPSQNDFTIPLEATVSLSKVYNKNKNSILGNVLKVIQTDSIMIQYKGVIRYHLGNFSYPYTIDKTQDISIK